MLTFTLTWVLPIVRVDGSSLAASEIASVLVRDSLAADPTAAIILPGTAVTYTTDDLSGVPGDHALSVSVVDTDGHEGPVTVAVGTVPHPATAAPGPVTNLQITSNQS